MTDKVNQVKHKKVKLSKPPIYKERKRLSQGTNNSDTLSKTFKKKKLDKTVMIESPTTENFEIGLLSQE